MDDRPANARNTSARTAEMVKLISEIGPDIPEIARRLGQFKESVRYRYKEKVLNRGFGVQASINHEKLGLRRVVMLIDFAPAYTKFSNSILTAMNELCYLVYFEKRMFRGDYLAEASVPAEHVDSFVDAMNKLKEKGLFVHLDAFTYDWFRTIPMRADSYDFDTGRWDFDWSAPAQPAGEAAYSAATRVKFDKEDLLILKELQVDATRSFVEVAAKLKLNYKMLAWHHKTHVVGRSLISGYYLRWMGTTYSTVLERALHRKHRYQHLAVLATGLTEVERMEFMGRVHRSPFIWNEMVGKNDYCAHFYFPTEYITEAYQFLTSAITDVKDKINVMPLDQTEALSFTVTHQLYDEKKKAWIFNEGELLSRFDMLIQKISEIGGP